MSAMKGLTSLGTSAGWRVFGSCGGCSEEAIGWEKDGAGTGDVERQKQHQPSSPAGSLATYLPQLGVLHKVFSC